MRMAPVTGTTRRMRMTETPLIHLLTWLSPSFPVGAFGYSHGLEQAVEVGAVRDGAGLGAWLSDVVRHGAGWSDGVLLAAAWRAGKAGDRAGLAEVAELGLAFASSAELARETRAQGSAFLKAVRHGWPAPALDVLATLHDGTAAYPVAVGVAAAAHGVPLRAALAAHIHAFAANLVSAGVRLIPLGQSDGLRVLAGLETDILETARRAEPSRLDQLANATALVDIASMQHETQYTRLFRS